MEPNKRGQKRPLPRAAPMSSALVMASSPWMRFAASEPPDELSSIVSTTLRSGDVMRISAVAGAGKSHALRAYAQAHPEMVTLLTMYNRSAADDQRARCADMPHVTVTTLNALAFHATRGKHHNGIVADDLQLTDAQIAGWTDDSILRLRLTLGTFMASDDAEILDAHVPGVCDGRDAVLSRARDVWEALCDPKCAPLPTHDALMKIYQLVHAPNEHRFGLVLLDEAHDCSASQLAAVRAMPGCAKIIVYDVHQCIYDFRGAVSPEALTSMPCAHSRVLSCARRYGEPLAGLASKVIRTFKPDAFGNFRINGRAGHQTDVHISTEVPVTAALDVRARLAVIGSTNISLVRWAYALAGSKPHLAACIGFAAGGPFAHVHPTKGAAVITALARFRAGANDVAEPALQRFLGAQHRWEEVQRWARGAHGQHEGIAWHAAIELVSAFDADELITRMSVYAQAASAPVVLVTAHGAKGLSWQWVALLDTYFYAETIGDLDAAARRARCLPAVRAAAQPHTTCSAQQLFTALSVARNAPRAGEMHINVVYVALTRAEQRLYIPPNTWRWINS